MRHIIRTCLLLLAAWVGYMVVRAVYRGVRKAMGLPVAEPSAEQRLFRQAVIGSLASTIVPFAYLHLDPGESRPGIFLLMIPAFFAAGVLWVSGVKGLVGLYRREPRVLLHPTVFITCVAASFSASVAGVVLFRVVRNLVQ